jgi:hypothetical protein
MSRVGRDIIALPGDPTADNTVTQRAFLVMKEGKTVGHDRREPK